MLKNDAIHNSSFRFRDINLNNINDINLAINIIVIIAITFLETLVVAIFILKLIIIIVINVNIAAIVVIVIVIVFFIIVSEGPCYASERKKPLIVRNAKETIRYDQLWVFYKSYPSILLRKQEVLSTAMPRCANASAKDALMLRRSLLLCHIHGRPVFKLIAFGLNIKDCFTISALFDKFQNLTIIKIFDRAFLKIDNNRSLF